MAIMVTQTIVFNCGTVAEYNEILTKANLLRTSLPEIYVNVVGNISQRRVTITTAAYSWVPAVNL